MDGVTILNVYYDTITTEVCYNRWWIGIIVLIGIFVIGLIFGLLSYEVEVGVWVGTIIGLTVGIPTGIICNFITEPIEVTDTIPTYEVTISKTVSMQDFTAKYEIIEQRGQIYVVKEREFNTDIITA